MPAALALRPLTRPRRVFGKAQDEAHARPRGDLAVPAALVPPPEHLALDEQVGDRLIPRVAEVQADVHPVAGERGPGHLEAPRGGEGHRRAEEEGEDGEGAANAPAPERT